MSSLQCIDAACGASYSSSDRLYTCARCGGLLDLVYELKGADPESLKRVWEARRGSLQPLDRSGVWRFRELLPEALESEVVTIGEGNTPLFDAPRAARFAGLDRLTFKHLGINPTGSFKDLGMTTGITQARRSQARRVACASTGNTSASMAAYAARGGLIAFVLIPAGQIALGKLAQALDYGAQVLQIDGDFDDAMRLIREVALEADLYLLNSVNPFRLEGQKTAAFELLEQLGYRVPDRLVVPGGNLGNSSALAKGFKELRERGLIERMPRLTIVQAEGANPLYRMWRAGAARLEPLDRPATLATAIKIGNPVSWPKAQRGLEWSGGEVEEVSEEEIAEAKATIGREGIGCEPASAVTLAGIRKMVARGALDPSEEVVAILTGHVLKDPDYVVNYHRGTLAYRNAAGEMVEIVPAQANRVRMVRASRDELIAALESSDR